MTADDAAARTVVGLIATRSEMENNSQQDDFQRVLRELDQIVDDSARLQAAIDEARRDELMSRRFTERRHAERRQATERRGGDRRQRP